MPRLTGDARQEKDWISRRNAGLASGVFPLRSFQIQFPTKYRQAGIARRIICESLQFIKTDNTPT